MQFAALFETSVMDVPYHATVAFINEDKLALSLCPESKVPVECTLFLLNRSGNELVASASQNLPYLYQAFIDDANGERILLGSELSPASTRLYASDLRSFTSVPFSPLPWLVAENVVVESKANAWTVHRLDPPFSSVASGPGSALALSDSIISFRNADTVITQDFQGRRLGSFSVKPKNKCALSLNIAEDDRLLLDECGRRTFVDYSGHLLLPLKDSATDPWSSRWNADRSRLLIGHAFRRVSPRRDLTEVTVALATLGAGVADQIDNEESVKVIDTKSGNTCFIFQSKTLLGRVGESHADISPSGDLVVVAGPSQLRLYRLPKNCNRKSSILPVIENAH